MGKGHFRARYIETVESADLTDLRGDMILEIDAALFAFGWLLVLEAIGYGGQRAHLGTALILFAGSAGSPWLRRTRLQAALYWAIAAPIAAVAWEAWRFPQGTAPYYFPLAVVISGLLVSNRGVFGVATLAAAACLAARWAHGTPWLDGERVLTPIALVYLTAGAAWLGSRQIHAALGWMQSSYTQARDLLEELRDRRMSLARTNKALEEAYGRIERMNYALIEARGAAEEARRLKAEFAANVSHELRTPLNIILGFSETMANAPETYAGVTWSPALRGDVEQVYQSSRHLASLIDDILDLSALDAHRLGLIVEETDIASVIQEAVSVVGNLFRAKNLYLQVKAAPDLPRLRIDPVRIRQVLINLLTNASRFTRTGGVTITAQMVGWEVQVAVADTGVGIAPQDVPRVFEDFGQVDGSPARRHEGSGLGVPLSKRLVELHGGRMWLESQPGQGTTFYFTLPVSAQVSPPWGAPPTRLPPPALGYRRAVLVAEPDPVVLRTLRRHLSSCDVIEVADPRELGALVAQHQPVALVAGRQSGDEADLWQTRLAGAAADLPVITVSLPTSVRAAQALGIEGVLIKPVTRDQLLAAIASLQHAVHQVLIVDDEPHLVELYSRMLQSAPERYHPLKALGGAEALARLRQQPVDLVLLDILMPQIDGLAVLKEMKADPALAATPVIVVSAQYPEAARTADGLFIQMVRAQEASMSETLTALAALVATLPPRGLPPAAAGPGSPAGPDGPPAS